MPKELFESEFFGHLKGSFTGAHRDRQGRFELADGGTLFLDEVAEIPPELQAKLLRVLQEGQFERIGDDKTRSVDVRVIAATNRNLRDAIERGKFREDFYYRLSVFPIEVPPLRDRPQDIVLLARHFLRRARKEFGRDGLWLTKRHVELLQSHDWPGNVRELRNVIERAAILTQDGPLKLELVMPSVDASGNPSAPANERPEEFVPEAEWQKRYRSNLIAALEAANWRVAGQGGAADLLGLKPSTLRDRMKSLDIRVP